VSAVEVYTTEDGCKVYRLGDLESTIACRLCKLPFIPRATGQRCCSEDCRYKYKLHDPEFVAKSRARSRAWAAAKRGCVKRAPWLLGQPVHEPYLPGGFLDMAVTPPPRYPMAHRNARGLHGMLTALVGDQHTHMPDWALVPRQTSFGWGIYVRRDEVLARLAGRTFDARLFAQPLSVTFGAAWRCKAPDVRKRGATQRVRVTAITPVVIESMGRTTTRTVPTTASLTSALTSPGARFPERLGLVDFDQSTIMLEVESHETEPRNVELLGKFGVVRGWFGSCVVRGNAVARWLLHAAARGPGLGARTSFGFGRVRVEDLP